jgi:lipid-binding SYLF domain-containing protein
VSIFAEFEVTWRCHLWGRRKRKQSCLFPTCKQAAGPIGRHIEADTDLDMEAEIYSYSKSKGLFAGVSLKGASIQIDRDANSAFYGPGDVAASDILYGKKTVDLPVLDKLKQALDDYVSGKV